MELGVGGERGQSQLCSQAWASEIALPRLAPVPQHREPRISTVRAP